MKKSLLFLVVFLSSLTAIFGQCSEDIFLTSQAEVDSFVLNNSCAIIEGNLSISGDIQDLSGLENITTILGDLDLFDFNVENLEGLGSLVSIEGSFYLSNNSSLINFKGLENLSIIQGSLYLSYNSSLANFDGLENLSSIGGDFYVSDNFNLFSFEGLENLVSIEGSFNVYFGEINRFSGLENLTTIGEEFSLYGTQITNFKGLENLQNVLFIEVSNNADLINFEGLLNLTEVWSLVVEDNESLINFTGLEKLKKIRTTQGFNSNSFTVSNNPNLINFEGLESLTDINVENIQIFANSSLINFEGLESLESIYNGFIVGGEIFISFNPSLINFEGLESLIKIEGQSGDRFGITHNSNLVSLAGLENVNIIGIDKGEISDNPKLEFCCPLLNFGIIENTENYSINDNAPSCNSLDVILPICSGTELQAQAFHDENENGTFDDTEKYLVQNFTLEPNSAYGFIDEVGINHFYLTDIGTYTISYEDDNPLWTIDPTYNNVEFVIQDITAQDTIIYFPLTSIADIASQLIDLSSSITRCNQETNYWLTYSNKGTVRTSGIIELIPDDLPGFISSNPPVDSTSNGKLYWFYNDLYPTHSKKIHLIYEMPGVDDLGEMINFEGSIKTNEGNAGHRALLSSELICAYDPNDKLNTPSGYGKENYTLFDDTLEYTIRFQNTGNDTAFNVEIRDELSELLNLSTFETISSSHNVETQIDLESRIATFRFNDIYLPDSFVNEPASHGFIKYQILGNSGINENSDVKNTASIYFDENPAIVTNTVNNRMVSELPSMPVVSANPSVLDFGEISLNNSSIEPQVLTISNLGDLPLEINAFEFGNAVFDAGELENLTIEGGKSEEITIYFKPTTVGEYLSELVLQSNVGNLTINLSGKATMETGLTTFHQTKVQIYPNPSEGRFTLKSEGEIIRNISIQNSLGEFILSQKVNNELFEFDLASHSKGLYFIIIKTKDTVIVERVVVY